MSFENLKDHSRFNWLNGKQLKVILNQWKSVPDWPCTWKKMKHYKH